MERVQYNLERSLPQLQLLDENSVFTKQQLRAITSQRSSFETRLVRQIPDKLDFLRYAEYEQNLAELISTKARRLELSKNVLAQNAAVHTGHIIAIYERLVKKFRYDVECWRKYLEFAKKRKMRVVAGRVYARALSLHPANIPLWLDAASYELNANASATAARALLQRAIRLTKLPWKSDSHFSPSSSSSKSGDKRKADHMVDSTENAKSSFPQPISNPPSGPIKLKLATTEVELLRLWVEYIRMELVFIERLRRRWHVLGLEWDPHGDNDEPNASLSTNQADEAARHAADQLEAEQNQNDNQPTENGEQSEALDTESALLSQVPEREQDVGIQDGVDQPASKPSNTFTPLQAHGIPAAQLAILRGSIPLFLVNNGLDSMPPWLHFVFLISVLELFRSFPFAESTKETLNGTVADRNARMGEILRQKLINAVYTALGDRSRWAWSDVSAVAVIVATRQLREPQPELLSEDEVEGWIENNKNEMTTQEQLRKASELRTTFSEDTDGLLDLADWVRMGGKASQRKLGSVSESSLPIQLVFQLLEAALVDVTQKTDPKEGSEENDGQAKEPLDRHITASLHSQRLARVGQLPTAVRQAIEYLRTLCVEAPRLSKTDKSVVHPKSLMYTTTTLLLDLLLDSDRSAIDEPNLLRYLEAVKADLIKEAQTAGPGVETAHMRVSLLRRKVAPLLLLPLSSSDSASANEAVSNDSEKRVKKLTKSYTELQEATTATSGHTATDRFPTSEDLWMLRIQVFEFLLLLSSSSTSGSYPSEVRSKMVDEWKRGLLTCSQDDSIDSVVSQSLWSHFFNWLSRVSKSDLSFLHEIYRFSIRETGSILSRAHSSSIVSARQNQTTIQSRRQDIHDLTIHSYLSTLGGLKVSLETAIEYLLTHSFGSLRVWQSQLDIGLPSTDRIFTYLLHRFPSVSLWIQYLGYLISSSSSSLDNNNNPKQGGGMKKALKTLDLAKRSIDPSELASLEAGWVELCNAL